MAAETTVRTGQRRVRLTSPDKRLFPADGITKADLAAYYADVEAAMRPHVAERPLNLWRWNAGIDRPVVVQQEKPAGLPDWVRQIEVPRRKGGTVRHVLGGAHVCVATAQLNCITPHVWTSRADRPDHPDRMVFDFDPPDEGDGHFEAIRNGALGLGDLLRDLGLEPYAMTSGSRGIHVVAPITRHHTSDAVRTRAGEIADEMAARQPDTLTTFWRKEKRGGRVLVDAARNTYGQTAVTPYAVRALPTAPVATPLRWEELDDLDLHPRAHTLATVPDRLRRDGDPWEGIAGAARRLPASPRGEDEAT